MALPPPDRSPRKKKPSPVKRNTQAYKGYQGIPSPKPASKPKPKPIWHPSKTQVKSAKAQQKNYVSQGRQVEATANRQKRIIDRNKVERPAHEQPRLSQAKPLTPHRMRTYRETDAETQMLVNLAREAVKHYKTNQPKADETHWGHKVATRGPGGKGLASPGQSIGEIVSGLASGVKPASKLLENLASGAIEGATKLGSELPGAPATSKIDVQLQTGGFGGEAIKPGKVTGEAAREFIDIPANLPASTYYLAKQGVEKGPLEPIKTIGKQYKEVIEHPGKAIKESPLTTALMFAPIAKGISKGFVRTEETALPGTNVTGRITVPRLQRTGGKFPAGRISVRPKETQLMDVRPGWKYGGKRSEIERRVDESVAVAQGLGQKVSDHVVNEFAVNKGSYLPTNFVKNPPAKWKEKGTVGQPQVFPGRGKKVRDQADARALTLTNKFGIPYEKRFSQSQNGYVIVPKAAIDRLKQHEGVKRGVAGEAFSQYSTLFRRVVLSTNPKWLAGNAIEATIRTAIARAGVGDYTRARKILREYKRLDPEGAKSMNVRTIAGGHYHLASTANVILDLGRNILEARKIREKYGKAAVPFEIYGKIWKRWQKLVFNQTNGWLESQFQTAMLGKAMRQQGIMPKHALRLSEKAVDEAVQGLRNTNTQVRLGRAIDEMYGRYGKFSPAMRHYVVAYTPFAAWYMNAVNFLYHVLPRDHPVLVAVGANASKMSEDYRKANGQYYNFGKKGTTPGYLQGSIPGKGGSYLRIGHYTPVGIFQEKAGIAESIFGTILPQTQTLIENAKGLEWTGNPLSPDMNEALNWAALGISAAEQEIPFVSVAHKLSGATWPNERKSTTKPSTFGGRVVKWASPFEYTKPSKQKNKSSKGSSNPLYDTGSGGGNNPLYNSKGTKGSNPLYSP